MIWLPISSRPQARLPQEQGRGPVFGRRALLKAGGLAVCATAFAGGLAGCAERAAEPASAQTPRQAGFFTDGSDFTD